MSAGTASDVRGLDNVIALASSVCRLSAEDGRLAYHGYDVRELGERSTAEETSYLLLHGELPTGTELRLFTAELRDRQKLPPTLLKVLKGFPPTADPMTVLRAALAVLAAEHAVPVPPATEQAMQQGLLLLGMTPTIVAVWHRMRSGQRPVGPRKGRSAAANFLAMVTGVEPVAEAARAFDTALIVRADNELNPSTFAARVTAATGADVFGCVLAGLSALAGPRHGWHTRNVMAALDEIGVPEQVEDWVRQRVALQKPVAGFGHVVYQGADPRTELLRQLAEQQCQRAGMWPLFRVARELETVVGRELGQHPIVDFYLAPLYRSLGLPTDLFTAVFAVSRMPGWVAHVMEQYRDEKLLRPRALYVGPADRAYRQLRGRR